MNRSHRAGSARAQLILGMVIGGLASALGLRLGSLFFERDVELFRVVRGIVGDQFVGDVDRDELVDEALRGMIRSLDPYSNYYGPPELALLERETSGEFHGIGVVFRVPTERGQVLFPFPELPAARAGVRVGDRFLEVEGRAVDELARGELQTLIQSKKGGSIQLRLETLDGEERELSVSLERVRDPSVRHARMLDAETGIAYLSLLSFTRRSPEEFDEKLAGLREQGMTSLVLDVRANPGGVLDSAVALANRFIREGTLVVTRTREATEESEAVAEEATLAGLPLVVLIDRASASASEVLAGALRDHGAACLVGETTYGKGTVQTLTQIDGDRAVVKLTSAVYTTPSGRRIDRSYAEEGRAGIEPDVWVEIDEETRRAIHRHLMAYSPPAELALEIRAWEETEGASLLPAHPHDPQLDAALAALGGAQLPRHESAH